MVFLGIEGDGEHGQAGFGSLKCAPSYAWFWHNGRQPAYQRIPETG
jgi:hypothetical protein